MSVGIAFEYRCVGGGERGGGYHDWDLHTLLLNFQ